MMTFDNRMAAIRASVMKMLERYSPPRAWSEQAQIEEVAAVAKALNSRIPSTDEASFHAALAEVLQVVAENARTRSWPTTGEFVSAWDAIQSKRRAAAHTETCQPDEMSAFDQLAVDKLMDGLAAGRCFHWLVNDKRVAEMERRGADLWDMHTVGLRLTRDQDRRRAKMPMSRTAQDFAVRTWAKVWDVDQREARDRLGRREHEAAQKMGEVKKMPKVFA